MEKATWLVTEWSGTNERLTIFLLWHQNPKINFCWSEWIKSRVDCGKQTAYLAGVDIHVHRIANRLGWTPAPTKTPEQTEQVRISWSAESSASLLQKEKPLWKHPIKINTSLHGFEGHGSISSFGFPNVFQMRDVNGHRTNRTSWETRWNTLELVLGRRCWRVGCRASPGTTSTCWWSVSASRSARRLSRAAPSASTASSAPPAGNPSRIDPSGPFYWVRLVFTWLLVTIAASTPLSR